VSTFLLRWKRRELGEVTDLSVDQPTMCGRFQPGPGLTKRFRELFAFITDEDRMGEEPPFAAELLDDDNWWLVDEQGRRWGISLPGVHQDDNIIGWRWRGEIPEWWA
jgi:hypothetical protein